MNFLSIIRYEQQSFTAHGVHTSTRTGLLEEHGWWGKKLNHAVSAKQAKGYSIVQQVLRTVLVLD
jgi:hypothetical protein